MIEKCRAAENAAKFADLFDHGDVHAHHGGDDSVADLALLGIMAFYTQDEAQLERLFSSSALGRREKWRQRDDYRRRTISRALASLGETYDWSRNNGGTAARPLKKSAAGAAGDEALPKLLWSGSSTGQHRPRASSSSLISYPATIPRRSTVGAAQRRA